MLEQRSVIKFSVAEKSKSCEMYRIIYGIYGEACLSQKIFSNHLNMGLPQARVKKQSIELKHINSPGKEKFLAQLSIKKVMLTIFWDIKGPLIIDFIEKVVIVNRAYFGKHFGQNSPYLLNVHRILAVFVV